MQSISWLGEELLASQQGMLHGVSQSVCLLVGRPRNLWHVGLYKEDH